MKAIVLIPGTKDVYLDDRPEPAIAAADDVKLQVTEVGICGTDREEAAGGRSAPPGTAPPNCSIPTGREIPTR